MKHFETEHYIFTMFPTEMNRAFTDYVRIFRIDEALEGRMEELLGK